MPAHRRPLPLALLTIAALSAANGPAQDLSGDAIELDPVLVNANRIFQLGSEAMSESDFRLDPASFRFRYDLDLSESLAADSSYSSFRQTRSYAAHPTTQGIRLRSQGATATSRTLVLYDGVPQNDPFGGWLYWHQYNAAGIESVSISSSGAGASWGNLGAGGLLSFVSSSPPAGSASADAVVGTSGLFSLNAAATQSVGEDAYLDLGFRSFHSDGFHTLHESQRGSVDMPAASNGYALNARLRAQPAADWKLQASAKVFQEERDNGTPVSVNDTDAFNLSLVAERALTGDSRINFVLYHQDRAFENVFSSVADDRNSERPALDQYDVPASATGGAVTYSRENDNSSGYAFGFDYRAADGSVNERYRNLGDGFTRDRYAGGEQVILGAFGRAYLQASDSNQLSATLRYDKVENENASRIETDTENNTVLLSDRYADRSSDFLSGNVNWRHSFSNTTSLNLNAFRGFRAPTLNELYRPFRVRNDITEANPLLENEEVEGLELSLLLEEREAYRFNLSLFHTRIDNMIANALLTTESGFDPRFGFIPDGGSGSQRLNMDETSVSGIELQAAWTLTDSLKASSSLTFAETNVDSDANLPQFVDKEFPQSSPLRARLALEWRPIDDWLVWTACAWNDDAYDDLGNTRSIDDSTTVSFGVHYSISELQSVGLIVDNLFDAEVQSGLANNGLLTIDAPREARLAWSWRR